MTLPTTVANFDAQYFGKRVLELGEKALLAALSEDNASTVDDYLMACEIIAASRGYSCEPSGWCYFAEEWLYASGFVASDEIAKQAVERLSQCLKVPGVKKHDLNNVRARLSKRPQKVKRANPKLSLTRAKKLARSFDDNVIEGKGFYGVAPNIHQAIAIIAFREFDTCSIGFTQPPNTEYISAFKILLIGMESTLESLEIDMMLPYSNRHGETDPFRILKQSLDQLRNLEKLKWAFFEDLYVDDEVICAVCTSAVLKGIRSKPSSHSHVTDAGIMCMLNCDNLVLVDLQSEFLTSNEGDKLLRRFPKLNLNNVPNSIKSAE